VLCLLGILSAAAVAQQSKPQFILPEVELTGGRIAGLLAGNLQQSNQQSGLPDILYTNARTVVYTTAGPTYEVTVGQLLNHQGFTNLAENQITFSDVLGVATAVADLDGDGLKDYAFALTPSVSGGNNLCVYYGSGNPINGGSSYSPLTGKSGCTSLPVQGTRLPNFAYIAATPFRTAGLYQLIVEDTANNYLYIVGDSGQTGVNGTLPGFTIKSTYALPPADGAGPIVTGDFNNDGNLDFIVNGQTGNSASVYFGNGDGTFRAPVRYAFDHNVHSLLMHDMDGDGLPDMVVEGDRGIIEIFHGNADGTFAATSEGGTAAGVDGFSGNGGHLAAIGRLGTDTNLDIVTATPIGISVLQGQGNLTFKLKGIYNAGPGRSAYALADFDGDGNLDLAIDSPEGVAIAFGRSDASFATSSAYAAGQPALNATLADFNLDGKPDVVVATGTIQAQVLAGNGDGTFNTLPAPTNTLPSPNPTLWSNVLNGDFDGDGQPDLLYSLTGLPLPTPGANAGSGVYLQYGNGDGTFQPPVALSNQLLGAPADNNFYGESAVADLNGDGIADIANLDTNYYDTLLSRTTAGAFKLGLNIQEDSGANDNEDLDSFSQVAAGVFHGNRTTQQDLVFQDDANITPYVNSGDGIHFTAMPPLSSPPPVSTLYGGTILIADIDGDGNGDIIVPYHNLGADPANPTPAIANQLYVWYGNGDGTFGQPVIATLSRNYYLAQIADMNNDGLPDIVLSDGYLVAILYNNGNRTFGGEQDFLAGQGINSISIADVNRDGSLDLILANGGVTISSAVALGGLTQLSLSLTPNPDVNTGGVTVLLNNILTRPVTGTLTASPNPAKYDTAFTLTVTLTPSAGVAPPTGTASFSINGTPVGSANVVAGVSSSTASFAVPAATAYTGTLSLTAVYSGDTVNSPATLYGTEAITGSPTTTTLALCIGPTASCPTNGFVSPPYVATLTEYYGQTYNGAAGVSSTPNDTSAITGTIGLYDLYNGVNMLICTLSVAPGSTCPPSVGLEYLPGVNVFTAVYSGDANHQPSTSASVTITMIPDTTSGSLSSSSPYTGSTGLCPPDNPQTPMYTSSFGQSVTFTLDVSGNVTPPTGTIYLLDQFGSLPPSPLSPIVPTPANTLATLTLAPLAGSASGSVATFTTSALASGTHPLTIYYPGNAEFNAFEILEAPLNPVCPSSPPYLPAYAPLLNQVVLPATYGVTLKSSVNPSLVGQAVTFTATIPTTPGSAPPPGTITFLDGTTTLNATAYNSSGVATFTTSALAVGSHNITAVISGTGIASATSAVLVQVVNPLTNPTNPTNPTSPTSGNGDFTITVSPSPVTLAAGATANLMVTVVALNGYNQSITLGCANLPSEATCAFANTVIPAGGGSTTLLLSTTGPHACGSTQPYGVGSIGPMGLPVMAPFAGSVLVGLGVFLLPGRRRWLRALLVTAAITCTLQMTACGNCTDLGTRPNTYTLQVNGTALSSTNTPELLAQAVTLTVTP
jgi:hypothetical protein